MLTAALVMANLRPPRTSERAARWQRRVMVAGGLMLGTFLLLASMWGVVATWRVVAAFRTGGTVVQWQDGPDLVVMAAPLLAGLIHLAWQGKRVAHPMLSCVAFALLAVLIGAGLGKGDALLLERIAAAHGYHHCDALDIWDPHGNRGGGPALRSWGYSRAGCAIDAG